MKKSAFTVIEMLSVIGIVLVLLGFLLSSVQDATKKSNLSAAKTILEKLDAAVRQYETAFGEYPPDLSYKYLGAPKDSSSAGRVMPMLQFEKSWVANPGDAKDDWMYRDPWMQAYKIYHLGFPHEKVASPGEETDEEVLFKQLKYYLSTVSLIDLIWDEESYRLKNGYIIWSAGPDKYDGSDDDIGNWGKIRSVLM